MASAARRPSASEKTSTGTSIRSTGETGGSADRSNAASDHESPDEAYELPPESVPPAPTVASPDEPRKVPRLDQHTSGTRHSAKSSAARAPQRSGLVPRPGLAKPTPSRASFCGAVLLSIIVMSAIGVFAVRQLRRMLEEEGAEPCGTDDCLLHAEFLKSHLNAASDPCTNLYAYVCGSHGGPRASTDDDGEGPNNATLEDEVMRLYAKDLARGVRLPMDSATGGTRLTSTAGDAAVASLRESGAFRACLERSSKEPQAFAEFMRQRGMAWPRRVDGVAVAKSTVLEVLFDLTVNWKVSLWFDLRVAKIVGNVSGLVIREPGPLVLLRRRQLRAIESLVDYAGLVRSVAEFLLNANSSDAGTLTDDEVRVLYWDDAGMRSMLDSLSDEDGQDETFTLKKVVALTAVNETSLLTLLKKYLPANDTLPESSAVLVFNERLLRAIFALLSRLPARRALDLIGWTFAYTYVWMVHPDFDHLAPPADQRYRDSGVDNRTLCFHAVQESFGLLRVARNLHERGVVPHFVDKAADVVRSIILVLVERIVQSDVISNVSKRTAEEKVLRSVSVPASLPAELQDPGPVDWIYASFPDNYPSFFDAWLATRDADSSADLRSVYEHPVVTSRYRWRSKDVLYLSSTNTLMSRIAAFYPPSYYQHGSVSMSYAGVGFQVAENVLGAILDRGRGVDDTNAKRFWWSASESCQWDLAKSDEEKAAARRLFALRIATEALQRNVNDSRDAFVQLKSMEQMSGRQTFYASFCSHFCRRPDGEAVCNVAMREEGFQDAFRCRWWWSRFGKRNASCLVV
ncbi:neprilysin-like [Dermacentor albipictus]|uniref:neprilysin-like n=1 Tax=Dermacentor albipictus TaxID=60249 RepID=UPI0038FC295F